MKKEGKMSEAVVVPNTGDRVRLIRPAEDNSEIPAGTEGIVLYVSDFRNTRLNYLHIGVAWDTGDCTAINSDRDEYEVV